MRSQLPQWRALRQGSAGSYSLPRSLSSNALYRQDNKLKLPISSLNEELMVMCSREVLQYHESGDPKVSQVVIEVRTGWKWKAAEVVEDAKKQTVLVGTVPQGRPGLGSNMLSRYGKVRRKDRTSQLQDEVWATLKEVRASRMVEVWQKGAWRRWEKKKKQ